MVEDNNGFLWICTDNGISRFDGKKFVNYSTKNGLPSNDVLQVIKEKDGTIWVNCYKQPPSYFDEKLNQFFSFENNKLVLENSKLLFFPLLNPNGGICFQNKTRNLYFQNKKINRIENNEGTELIYVNGKKNFFINKIKKLLFFNENGKYDYTIRINRNTASKYIYKDDNVIYQMFDTAIDIVKFSKSKLLQAKTKILQFDSKIKWFKITQNEIAVFLNDGNIFIYDKHNYQLNHQFKSDKNINSYYKDSHQNIWLGSVDNGLLKYSNTAITSFSNKTNQNSNFLSIHVDDKNTIYTGNFNSQLFEYKKDIEKVYCVNSANIAWLRKIHSFNNKIICISDNGYSVNFSDNTNIKTKLNAVSTSLKTSEKLNDSILLIGTNSGLLKLNVDTYNYNMLPSPEDRILNIKAFNQENFYFTSGNGIYSYNLKTQQYKPYFLNENLLNDNIQNIEITPDNEVWAATSKGNLYLIKKGVIQFKLINEPNFPINVTKLLHVESNLWIASKSGIYILDVSNLKKYAITKITVADGLKSDFINDLFFKDDFIYAATSNGYAIIPNKKFQSKYDVKPKLISIKIIDKTVAIKKEYNLNSDQNFVSLEIAGVDLTGHFNRFRYKINDGNWIYFEDNLLNLKFNGGTKNLTIQAIDVNGNISKDAIHLLFHINIPFYLYPFFWITIVLLFFILFFMYLSRKKIEKQQIIFDKKLLLEQQRSKITADLHDEIGSTLSSLQINSTIANQLLDKNSVEVKKVLKKIEQQAEQLSDKIGDIIWSMKPGKEEFLPLSSRIKNYANDILAASEIKYIISIDEKIDYKITDINIRKNILLFSKEAINNATKYSEATSITVDIKVENNKVSIVILDNGIGFDVANVKGNGIGNMQNRIKELNGQCEINSQLNVGTIITATFPFVP